MQLPDSQDACKFPDVLSFLPKAALDELKAIDARGGNDVEQATIDVIMKADLLDTAPCTTHNRHCPYRKTDIETTSSSCRDWSKEGKRLGACGGDFKVLVMVCRLLNEYPPKVFFHENTELFDENLFRRQQFPMNSNHASR